MDGAIGITDAQLAHFERNGFFFVPNPIGAEGVREVDARLQVRVRSDPAARLAGRAARGSRRPAGLCAHRQCRR